MARGNKNKGKFVDNSLEELFNDAADALGNSSEGIPVDGLEDIYELNLDIIGQDANTMASSNIQNLLRCYNSKEFVEEHPDFKRRIDTEIEGLRKLYKMAKIDEEIHDHLCTAISKNPSNASLYMAQARIQDKILVIDKEIRERIAGFNKIISGYQLELNFSETRTPDTDAPTTTELNDGAVLSRGSKAFIEQMNREEASHEYDPDDLPPFCEVNDAGQVIDTDTGEIMGKIKE